MRPRAGANAPRAKLIPRSSVRWTPTVCHPTLRESRGGISPCGDPVSDEHGRTTFKTGGGASQKLDLETPASITG